MCFCILAIVYVKSADRPADHQMQPTVSRLSETQHCLVLLNKIIFVVLAFVETWLLICHLTGFYINCLHRAAAPPSPSVVSLQWGTRQDQQRSLSANSLWFPGAPPVALHFLVW